MKAMIFAAGLGTRLKPLTDSIPKALAPVGGKPLLEHLIGKLKVAGFDEIIINVHHFAGQIIEFVKDHHSFDIRIVFSDERGKLLDTGGGIKKASWFFDDNKPFLVHNVDILSNTDLRRFYEAHRQIALPSPTSQQSPAIASLVCSERETARYLLFDGDNHLKGWINEKTGEVKSPFPKFDPLRYKKLAFSGIQILQPSVFRYMDGFPDRFSIIDFYLSICNEEILACYTPDHLKLMDVGKTGSLQEAARFLNRYE